MKTRARFLSFVLIAALLLQIIPTGVFAVDDDPVSSESPIEESDSETIEMPNEDSDPINIGDESDASEELNEETEEDDEEEKEA